MTNVPRPSASTRPAPTPAATLLAVALAALALALGGCASGGTTLGDEIGAAGKRYAAIGERWEDGRDYERLRASSPDIGPAPGG